MLNLTCLHADHGLWRITGETNGYLLVRGSRSLLIDCPADDLAGLLHGAGLPLPETIVHTQVQEEHCREWAAFPQAQVYVATDSAEVARRSAAFFAACATVWPPSREWDTRGEETYGIAGCVTERPPIAPLAVAGLLQPGETFQWEDIRLEVLPLPGSGKRSIGFYWRETGMVFSGDLIRAGGYLVNFYDLERSYGLPSGYTQLIDSLAAVAQLAPALLLPSTGPVIDAPAAEIATLHERLARIAKLPAFRTGQRYALTNYPPLREFGRYREVAPGIFQNNNFGNMILYVDAAGHGLLVDPDPCVWLSWEENCREVHADLDLLERETGLRRIEVALVTHIHGDHAEYSDLLRARYGTEILTTPDVADVMERPREFPYPSLIHWYGFPFDHITVDRRLPYEVLFHWHDVAITPIPLSGHCYAHAGFVIPWRGLLTVCTGDTLQYGDGAICVGLPIMYSDTAWPERGFIPTFARLLAINPDLVLGGHSHSFFDPDGSILQDWLRAAQESQRLAAELVPEGTMQTLMTPPGFDAVRPSRQMLATH